MRMTASAIAFIAFSLPLHAQDTMSSDAAMMDMAGMVTADNLTDSDLYAARSNLDWTADTTFDARGDDWDEIGEVDDLIMDRSGIVQGVLIEVGGFLGIGDKTVMIPMSNVRIVAPDGEPDNVFLVTNETEESLKALPEVDDDLFD